MDGHLNCLHFLAVVPSDTVNICVQAFQYLFLTVSVWSGISGSCGSSLSDFLKNLISPYSCQCFLLLSVLSVLAILGSVR